VSYYPRLTAELVRRGWSKDELRGLFGQNILRVLRANEAVAQKLQAEGTVPSGATIADLDGAADADPSL